jgi:outer membrane lipoprotein-sorting protein
MRKTLVAVAVLAAAIGGGAAGATARANRAASLPPVAADQLVASAMKAVASTPSLSGAVTSHVDLGLPSLSGLVAADANPTDIVAGDHTVRLWHSADGFRIDDLLPMAQRSLYVSRTEAWAWDSQTFTAYHITGLRHTGTMPASPVPSPDPLEMARRALAAIDPTTQVSVETARYVAGRAAYVLRLTPRTTHTLVGAIEISIDAATRVPLRVAVFARGATKPAVSEGFTTVRFGPVDAGVYRFAPPSGATVKTVEVPRTAENGAHASATVRSRPDRSGDIVTSGAGWTEMIAFRLPARTGPNRTMEQLARLLPYSGPLFSLDLVSQANQRWIVAGMVPAADLAAFARTLP